MPNGLLKYIIDNAGNYWLKVKSLFQSFVIADRI